MDVDSVSVTSEAAQLFEIGNGVGLVTSVPPDDVTPGAFYAYVPNRKYYYITVLVAKSGYQFLGGSKLRGIKDKDGQPNNLLEILMQYKLDYLKGVDAA